MKYNVSLAVEGRVNIEVDADSFEQARAKANMELCCIDLGDLEPVDWHAVNAENELQEEIDY